MNNIGLEVIFWTVLSIYLMAQFGVFKKKSKNHIVEKKGNEKEVGCNVFW